MKKEYITPSLLMLEVEMEQMIETSTSIPVAPEPAADDYPGGGDAKYFDGILDDSENW